MTAATREGLLPWADVVIGPYSLALDNKTENIFVYNRNTKKIIENV